MSRNVDLAFIEREREQCAGNVMEEKILLFSGATEKSCTYAHGTNIKLEKTV